MVRRTLAALAAVALAAGTAPAQLVDDPAGDFLSSYVGPRNAELDVTGAQFVLSGSTFRLISRSAGPLSNSSGALFVWGVNRGRGTAGFAGIGITGVLFDAVIIVNPTAGTAVVNDLVNGGGPRPLPVGSFAVDGAMLDVTVPTSFLPLLAGGFGSVTQYTANLWPRSGAGNATVISDFAPDNSNLAAAVVPEPATFGLVLAGLAGVAVGAGRRRARARA